MKRTIFALSLTLALCASAFGQHWEFESIDSLQSNQYGTRITLRELPDGRLGACYGVTEQGIVRFAVRDSHWEHEDIAVSGLAAPYPSFEVGQGGSVVVCYDDTGSSMHLALRTDTGWVRSAVPYPGRTPVIALDRNEDPYILCCPQVHAVAVSRRDSAWDIDTVLAGYPMGYYEISYGPALFPSDSQTMVFAGFFYDYNLHVYGASLYLKQWSGGSWQVLWSIPDIRGLARALSSALDSAGRPVTCYWVHDGSGDSLYCAGDVIDGAAACATVRLDSLDRPHVAYVADVFDGVLKYAWRSRSGWQVTTVPETHAVRSCDLVLGRNGQPLIAYCRTDGGIRLARGVDIVGVDEATGGHAAGTAPNLPTVVRGVLGLAADLGHDPNSPGAIGSCPASLLDAAGRRVMELRAGANDVSELAPGVYFVRKCSSGPAVKWSSEKVVIAR